MKIREVRELLATIPPEDDELELEYATKYGRTSALDEYDSYEGMETGQYAVCNLYYRPGERVQVEHW